MSSFLAPTRTRARLTQSAQRRARLAVVRGGSTHAPRVPFAALVLTVVALGLVGLLVLNTSLQQGAFYARDLEARAQTLTEQREALQVHVAELREPQKVAEKAADLGMVPNPSPAFLRLSDGKVLGNPSPAGAETAPQFLTPPRAVHATHAGAGRNGSASHQTSERQGSGR
jgi:cell division protein FtsL